MLRAFDASGRHVTIQEINDDNGFADWPNRTVAGAPQPFFDRATGRPGTPDDAVISYNPTFNQFPFRDPKDPADDWRDVDPLVVLYHEMSHSYDIVNGTLQKRAVRRARPERQESKRHRTEQPRAPGSRTGQRWNCLRL
jgi:hypothetical protein